MNSMTSIQNGSTSSRPRIALLSAALPVALLLLAPLAPLHASTTGDQALQESTVSTAASPERAAELESRAWEMRDEVGQRKAAARLYRQAAELRDDSDPLKVQSLRNASRMNFYAGRTHRALEDAAEAARLALRQGDVVTAAHVHVDAAWLAMELGQGAAAEAHLADARMLAASPLLAQAQRVELMNRLATPV